MILESKKIAFAVSFAVIALNQTEIFAKGDKPNILFIAIDDLNSSPHIMGGENSVYTPNLERLAQKGMLFTNAHCAAPSSGPSRASIMSGMAPSNSGVYTNTQDWRECTNLKDWITIPDHFRNNGYKVIGGGKLYHGSSLTEKSLGGLLDGEAWDDYFPSKTQQLFPEVMPEKFPANGNIEHYNGFFDWYGQDITNEQTGDGRLVSWAKEQLSKQHEKPLFLGVGLYKPHIPWYVPQKYFDMHPLDEVVMPETPMDDLMDVPQTAKGESVKLKLDWHKWMVENNKYREGVRAYNACISFMDDMIGQILDALENGPNSDNTIIVLWSDHGYHTGQKEHWEKYTLWEISTRVPFIVVDPKGRGKGKECAEPVSLLDVYPTLVELSETENRQKLDGESVVSLLENPTQKSGRAVVTTLNPNSHGVRSDRWRYIEYPDGSCELYDQKNDPKDFINLANKPRYSEVIEQMKGYLPTHNEPKNPIKNYKQ
ncbi:MAG: sulfatase [Rikenellaceae bacterium]